MTCAISNTTTINYNEYADSINRQYLDKVTPRSTSKSEAGINST